MCVCVCVRVLRFVWSMMMRRVLYSVLLVCVCVVCVCASTNPTSPTFSFVDFLHGEWDVVKSDVNVDTGIHLQSLFVVIIILRREWNFITYWKIL